MIEILVTSLAEVWIEIFKMSITLVVTVVTSLAEVWIEISRKDGKDSGRRGHFPCGSVD